MQNIHILERKTKECKYAWISKSMWKVTCILKEEQDFRRRQCSKAAIEAALWRYTKWCSVSTFPCPAFDKLSTESTKSNSRRLIAVIHVRKQRVCNWTRRQAALNTFHPCQNSIVTHSWSDSSCSTIALPKIPDVQYISSVAKHNPQVQQLIRLPRSNYPQVRIMPQDLNHLHLFPTRSMLIHEFTMTPTAFTQSSYICETSPLTTSPTLECLLPPQTTENYIRTKAFRDSTST